MVGTQQPRKGVSLFSQVADLAQAAGLPARFHWYGAPVAIGRDEYRSPHAVFHSHASPDRIERILSQARLFFLSSMDDPLPLGALEAIAAGIPVVASRSTGIAEIIDAFGNGAVFSDYTPAAALQAIRTVLDGGPGIMAGMTAARRGVTCEAFVGAACTALQSVLIHRQTRLSSAPVLWSRGSAPISPPAFAPKAPDLTEVDRVLARVPRRKIDLAQGALRAGRYDRAFRISAAALRETPTSSRHHRVLREAAAHLGEEVRAEFQVLDALHAEQTQAAS
jgi:hypothetical protein